MIHISCVWTLLTGWQLLSFSGRKCPPPLCPLLWFSLLDCPELPALTGDCGAIRRSWVYTGQRGEQSAGSENSIAVVISASTRPLVSSEAVANSRKGVNYKSQFREEEAAIHRVAAWREKRFEEWEWSDGARRHSCEAIEWLSCGWPTHDSNCCSDLRTPDSTMPAKLSLLLLILRTASGK